MSERPPLRLERDGGVLTLSHDDPPLNRMSFERAFLEKRRRVFTRE